MINLILTSDDFGMSPIFDDKMMLMIEEGFLSSVSIMVAREIANLERRRDLLLRLYTERDLSLGLHLEVKDKNVSVACERQWDIFTEVFGLQPDYVDVHKQHVSKFLYDSIAHFCVSKDTCFRKYRQTSIKVKSPSSCLISTYTNLDSIIEWINSRAEDSMSELVFHIGSFDPQCKSHLNGERENEINRLKSVYNYAISKQIKIVSYHSITTLPQ